MVMDNSVIGSTRAPVPVFEPKAFADLAEQNAAIVSVGISELEVTVLPGVSASGADMRSNPLTQSFSVIVGAILKLSDKRGSPGSQEAVVLAILAKTKKTVDNVMTTKLLNLNENIRGSIEKKSKNLEESQNKIEQAQGKEKRARIWSKISDAFAVLASVVSIAVGSLMVVTGAGAVAGALMIAGGVVGLLSASNSIHASLHEGEGFMSEKATLALMIVGMVLAAATLVVGIAGIGNIKNAVSGIIGKAGQAGEAAATGAEALSTTTKAASGVAQTVTTVGESVSLTGASLSNVDAAETRAEADHLRADGMTIEAATKFVSALIEAILQMLSAESERFSQMTQVLFDSSDDDGKTLANARFRG